jgi:exopolyphosphatase / guanosine-5'-triphosphate,3'-diphosphate pyrophosphatase
MLIDMQSSMERPLAAIDIGTYTARLLIASGPGPSGQLRSFARKRAYIRLAEGFDHSKKRILPGSIDRTLKVLDDFLHDIRSLNVCSTHAIATGVVREATNRDEFLGRISEQTGIRVRLISGDEEAQLTAKGVLHALGVQNRPILIFDLGGGSTEFFLKGKDTQIVRSIPLGAMILTKGHLKSAPPKEIQVDSLSEDIDHCLNRSCPAFSGGDERLFVVGTGGTVTTLALMLHEIAPEDISAERINGLVLERQHIEILFDKMRGMTVEERSKLPGLDKGRAEIILAGSLVVIRILHFLKAVQLTVSLSDLLEGILINHFLGRK